MEKKLLKGNTAWKRPFEPVIVSGGEYGKSITMNPCAVMKDNDIYLFYAADNENDRREIHLVIFENGDFENPKNMGAIVTHGEWGAFDGNWCVLPMVVFFKGKWHMYYAGNSGIGEGLARFPGIGLATSDDLIHWEKYSDKPLISPSHIPGAPDEIGIASGGIMVLPDGRLRLYYTGLPSVGHEHFINQNKFCCIAESEDGINWEKKGAAFSRMFERDYRDVAATGGPCLYEDGMFKIWHPQIGTRWGFYSIGYAESDDGFNWRVGECYGDELALGPRCRHLDASEKYAYWDYQMVSYPSVFVKDGKRYMFYCGNDYGRGGIGLAVACNSRVYARDTELFIIKDKEKYPLEITAKVNGIEIPKTNWVTPDADCNLRREAALPGINVRLCVTHTLNGLKIFATPMSEGIEADVEVTVDAGSLACEKDSIHIDKFESKVLIMNIEY